jgi:hypothetical protein
MPVYMLLEVDKRDPSKVARFTHSSTLRQLNIKVFEEAVTSDRIAPNLRVNVNPMGIKTNRPGEIYYEGELYNLILFLV